MNKAIKSGLFALALCCILPSSAKRYTGEYFWNTDPGVGRATKMDSKDVGSDNTMNVSLNLPTLSPGFNMVGIRVFDGHWSPTITGYVYIPAPDLPAVSKGVCEYYWDTDPGVGYGIQTTFSTNGNGISDMELNADGLSTGIHTLGLRAFVGGKWSPTNTSIVFVLDKKAVTTKYVEYFWYEDPGYGNGTKIKVSAADIVTISKKDISLPETPVNDYKITVRARSSSGEWGPSYVKIFSLGSSVDISLDKSSISIDGIGDIYKLNPTVTSDAPEWPRPVTWSSSDETVATVDADGNVKAVGKGDCVITAECTGTAAYAECACKVTGTRYVLRDGQVYDMTDDVENAKIQYVRTFNNTNWQPLFIPYCMKYEDWHEYADVAELVNAMMYDDDGDGIIDRTNIEFKSVTSGTLRPNKPYLIRARQTGETTFTSQSTTLYGATNGYVDCVSTRWIFTLQGTYVPLTQEVHGPNVYVMSSGKFVHTTGTLNPYRFYLTMEQRTGGYWDAPGQNPYPEEIGITVDGVACSIEGLIADPIAEGDYYDILGRKIENPTPGLYIRDGEKVIIK